MLRTTFIPAANYDALTAGLAADIAKLTPEVDGGTAHKVAEVLSRYGLFPEDMAKQIIADQREEAARQMETAVPRYRPAIDAGETQEAA